MAIADVAETQDRSNKRRPFTSWMKRLATRKQNNDSNTTKKQGNGLLSSRSRKGNAQNNNPYPSSGYVPRASARSSEDGHLSFATSNPQHTTDEASMHSEALVERDGNYNGKRSAAPTVNTKAETLHSDAGHSKATTSTTRGGAVSSIDGAGANSTFSSPNQSLRSLTTTLTTIQSTAPGNTLSPNAANGQTNTPVLFSHQYPVSPVSSSFTASAIPRHVSGLGTAASNTLTDDASILTLASSSKRRRRSMDTDASVRALAPSSLWGGSRESLPLSVLSNNVESHATRPPLGAERASVYSSQGVTSGIATDRNSYYAGAQKKDLTSDTKSLRSINNLDSRSQYDAKSITDGKSMDVGSLRGYEGSMRGGALGHNRQDSIPGSIGGIGARHLQGGMSRRSSDWAGADAAEKDEDAADAEADPDVAQEGSELKAMKDE